MIRSVEIMLLTDVRMDRLVSVGQRMRHVDLEDPAACPHDGADKSDMRACSDSLLLLTAAHMV